MCGIVGYVGFGNASHILLNTLKKLALFFDTSIDYLLGLTDEQKPYPRI